MSKEIDEAARCGEDALAIFRSAGDDGRAADTVAVLSLAHVLAGNARRARATAEEAVEAARRTGDDGIIARALNHLALALESEPARARLVLEEARALAQGAVDARTIRAILGNLGFFLAVERDFEAAVAANEELLDLARQQNDRFHVALALGNLGVVCLYAGKVDRARRELAEAMRMGAELGPEIVVLYGLDGVAGVAASDGFPERAARLFGAADGLRARRGIELSPAELAENERFIRKARDQIGAERFAHEHACGLTMTLDEAVAYALEAVADPEAPSTS